MCQELNGAMQAITGITLWQWMLATPSPKSPTRVGILPQLLQFNTDTVIISALAFDVYFTVPVGLENTGECELLLKLSIKATSFKVGVMCLIK